MRLTAVRLGPGTPRVGYCMFWWRRVVWRPITATSDCHRSLASQSAVTAAAAATTQQCRLSSVNWML